MLHEFMGSLEGFLRVLLIFAKFGNSVNIVFKIK